MGVTDKSWHNYFLPRNRALTAENHGSVFYWEGNYKVRKNGPRSITAFGDLAWQEARTSGLHREEGPSLYINGTPARYYLLGEEKEKDDFLEWKVKREV